jgi:hypothetical protein
MVAVSARNIETNKELPAEHLLAGDRAAGLQLVKRRRGAVDSTTATWEIGYAHRRLHTPGGLYLQLHRLMGRGRGFTGSGTVWSVWATTPDVDSSTHGSSTNPPDSLMDRQFTILVRSGWTPVQSPAGVSNSSISAIT